MTTTKEKVMLNRRIFVKGCLGLLIFTSCSAPEKRAEKKQACMRCGKCCQLPEIQDKMWSDCSDLSDEQREILLRERSKYPKNTVGCGALIFEKNGLASCLIHKLFGYKLKPRICKLYPKDGELCIYYSRKNRT